MLGQSAPLQGCMVARVARICYEELQVVAAELPENLSCVALQGLYRLSTAQDKQPGVIHLVMPIPFGRPE